MENEKKNNIFSRFFNPNRFDRPDALDEDTTPTVKRYFKLLGRRFWKLVSLNLMMLPMVLPLIVILYLFLGIDRTPTATFPVFSQLYGANLIDPSTEASFLLDLFGRQTLIPVYNVTTYVLIGICVLFLAVTFGWQNVGASYILRNMVRGEPVFMFSDYFYAIRRNLRQGFLLGLLDLGAIVLLVFDIQYFSGMTGTFFMDFCFWSMCAVAVIYFFMRFYIYLMLVTFNLSIKKILKNALIFTPLGIKRNVMGLLGILTMTALNVALFFALIGFNIAIPLILPVVYYLSFTAFTSAYAAYPIIDRYMIQPYQTPNSFEEEVSEVPEE